MDPLLAYAIGWSVMVTGSVLPSRASWLSFGLGAGEILATSGQDLA